MITMNLRALKRLSMRLAVGFYAANALAALPIQHWVQPSGAEVYLVQSPAIPMVDVRIDFDAGARRDPADKPGLAQLMAGATSDGVRASGTEAALDEAALADAWADRGASFSGSASNDRLSFNLRTLSYPDLLSAALALAARQLGEPAFPEALWLRDRPKLLASLKEEKTRPASVAARAYAQAVYGSHPYGSTMQPDSLLRIGVQDFADWHARFLRPCYAKVSVVGALDRAQADAAVAQLLSRLPAGGCEPLEPVPPVPALAQAQQLDIPFNAAQAQILIGQPGYARSDPQHFALLLGNQILGGGGFTSRLTAEVREKRGLSYSVYSHFAPGLHAGAFTIGLQTRADQAQQALQVVRTVLARFVAEGPTAQELQAAKANLVAGFPLLLDSNRKLLDNVANMAWYGLPLDYLDTWTQQVQRVSVADVRAALQRVLQPERMVTLVLGAQSAP